MKYMRIAGICGRGIEGCGQTKFMTETKKALEYVGNVCDLVISTDYSFPRKDAQVVEGKYYGKFEKDDFTEKMIEVVNDYDAIILFSVPATRFTDKCKDNFLRFLKVINKKIVYIVVDHARQSLSRNANFEEICRTVDLILTHSLKGSMAKYVEQKKIDTPVDYLYTSRNFDEMKQEYWKPVEEMNLKAAKWIGRAADWKKPSLFVDFCKEKLNPNGYVTSMEGLERSFPFLRMFFVEGSRKNGVVPGVDLSRYDNCNYDNFNTEKVYVCGPYKFTECMERMSKCGFGADLYTLNPDFYGRSLEQCHNDIIACGCIPIFSKHFGEYCMTIDGRRWIDACPDVLYLSEDNFDEIYDKMVKLVNDPKLFDETRNRIYEFFKTQGDISAIGPKYDEIMKNLVK